jgi:FMN-dependent NADH-azoreductase
MLCKEQNTMPTLLRIDSSPLPGGASISRQLTDEFVQHWREANPDGKVITRDLGKTDLPLVTAEWIGAAYAPEAGHTAQQQKLLAISSELIGELQTADEYVIGVPMHNFSITGLLKLWIDQIARAGKTFAYENGKPAGLLRQKKATFLVASGGVYDQGTPMAAMNFAEPYLRSVFGFLGVTDTTFISAGGMAQLRFGADRETVVKPAVTSIRAQFLQAA